jgi:hypothetical protein
MLLANGGQIALTALSDPRTRTKWSGLLGARELEAIRPADFEVVDGAEPIPLKLGCVRNP